jgi:alkylation response protein AidB-like acyl-CoA dehydrogenase
VFVADQDVLGDVGEGFELTKDWFTDERIMIAARTTGASERALGLARDWALEREQFGQPIAEFQMVQAMLADCAVDIAVNRAFTYQVAWEADQGVDRKTLHAKASMAKLSASEAAGRVMDRCVQIFGGRGYLREYAVERFLPRGARRPDLGGHVGDPASDHRQRAGQAGDRRARPASSDLSLLR